MCSEPIRKLEIQYQRLRNYLIIYMYNNQNNCEIEALTFNINFFLTWQQMKIAMRGNGKMTKNMARENSSILTVGRCTLACGVMTFQNVEPWRILVAMRPQNQPHTLYQRLVLLHYMTSLNFSSFCG